MLPRRSKEPLSESAKSLPWVLMSTAIGGPRLGRSCSVVVQATVGGLKKTQGGSRLELSDSQLARRSADAGFGKRPD